MENTLNQIIGTRKVIKEYCDKEDWENAGMKIPSKERQRYYVLGQCMNCGHIKPFDIKLAKRNPPKRCSYCSNIGNHSTIPSITNSYYEYENYAVINILFQKEIYSAFIDKEDVEKCKTRSWRLSKKRNKFYVVSGQKKNEDMIYLHQFLIGKAPNGYEIDHKDGNSLNNQKRNLQYLTRSENARNTKSRIDAQIGIKGISIDKRTKKYVVDFSFGSERIYSKSWTTLSEATWFRYFLETYYDLELLKNNPLFSQYNTLTNKKKQEIANYACSQIAKYKKLSVQNVYTKTNSWSKERKEEFKLREWMPLNEKGTEA